MGNQDLEERRNRGLINSNTKIVQHTFTGFLLPVRYCACCQSGIRHLHKPQSLIGNSRKTSGFFFETENTSIHCFCSLLLPPFISQASHRNISPIRQPVFAAWKLWISVILPCCYGLPKAAYSSIQP